MNDLASIVKRLSVLFCCATVFQLTHALADPLPVPTPEASKIDIMGLRLGMSPDEIKPIIEAAQPGIKVQIRESVWPDGTKYVSEMRGDWSIPNKNNPTIISRGEILDVHFSAPASGNKSFWIYRQAAFFDGNEVSKEATLKALAEKYGKPTDIGRVGIDYKWTYGNLNGYSNHELGMSLGECSGVNFNSNCPDAFLAIDATPALVATLLSSIRVTLKDNRYGLVSLRYDGQARAMAKKAADEKAGKMAAAPRL